MYNFFPIQNKNAAAKQFLQVPAPLAAESAQYPEIETALYLYKNDFFLFGRRVPLTSQACNFLYAMHESGGASLDDSFTNPQIRMLRAEINAATRDIFKDIKLPPDFCLIKIGFNKVGVSPTSLLDINNLLLEKLRKKARAARDVANIRKQDSTVATATLSPIVPQQTLTPASSSVVTVETSHDPAQVTPDKSESKPISQSKETQRLNVDPSESTSDVATTIIGQDEAIAPEIAEAVVKSVQKSNDRNSAARLSPEPASQPNGTLLPNVVPLQAPPASPPLPAGAIAKNPAPNLNAQSKIGNSGATPARKPRFLEPDNRIKPQATNSNIVPQFQRAFALLLRNTAAQYKVEGIGELSSLYAFHSFVGNKLERYIGNIDTRLSVTQSITRLYDGSEPPLDASGNLTLAAQFAISFLQITDRQISRVAPELAPAVEARRAKLEALRKQKEATL